MRKTLFLFLLLLMAGNSSASAQQAKLQPEVMESVELMSIIARTAGYQEYCNDLAGKYTEDTEAWFGSYRNHPTVDYFKNIRNVNYISYDAVISMALHIEADNGQVKYLKPKDGFKGAKGIDPYRRWDRVNLDTLLVKLNQFYADTRFHDFFQQHQSFYNNVINVFENKVLHLFNQDWYSSFYGVEPTENYRIVIGFTTGGNYGPTRQLVNGPLERFAIYGYCADPNQGRSFENGKEFVPTLIHVFNHTYVNPLLHDNAENAAMVMPIAETLLEHADEGMGRQGYRDPGTLINESLVRAAVVLYLQDNGFSEKEVQQEMYTQISDGFAWMPELVKSMRNYTRHRGKYPTLNEYYPEIAKVLKKYIATEQKRVEKSLK